ncbi:precorrin-3B synthase, partial [Actinoplanes sp. NPDC051633]|uniref:precorrin-3B synthase n=1 Tax=Actinoplanes sp. NPDC051633 TaxID=3155670 RepID=UPI0034154FD6
MSSPSVRSSDIDACPGALRLHAAADGPLARVRLPGGLLTGAQVRVLRDVARRWGDGQVELTSRANVQVRALTAAPPEALAEALRGCGLLPSDTHELVRNIAASPVPGAWDVRTVARALDRAVCADPALAALPGRFLFALGPVPAAADLAALQAPTGIAVLFAGRDLGLRVDPGAVVPALIAAAHAFLDVRAEQATPAWRLRELADGPSQVAARTAAAIGAEFTPAAPPPAVVAAEPIGLVAQPGGLFAAAALVPLGTLSEAQLTVLGGAETCTVTPWRGVVVPDLERPAAEAWLHRLGTAGLEVSPGSRWSGVTACAVARASRRTSASAFAHP